MTIGEQTYGWQESNEVIRITQEAFDSIVEQAKKDAPVESCGYALGIVGEDGKKTITYNYTLTNIDHAVEHFSLDPKEQFAAIKYARTHGLAVIGGWHSHPASPSRPSEEDKRLAFDPNALYLILSLSPDVSGQPFVPDGEPVLNAFRIKEKEVTRFPVIV